MSEHPVAPISAEVNLSPNTLLERGPALAAFLDKQAGNWLDDLTLANLEQKLGEAGLAVEKWGETWLASSGGAGPSLLVYLPPDANQHAHWAAALASLAAWRENGGLPANLKILAGPLDAALLETHKAELSAQAIIYNFGEYVGERPLVSLGLKGLLEIELKVQTLNQPAPAAYSEIMPAASWILVRALDALKSDTQEIKIEDFENDLIPLPGEESKRLLKQAPEHSARLVARREKYGLSGYIFDLSDSLVLQTETLVPTVNISAIECGDFEKGRLQLPPTARARLDIHLLPNQRPEFIFEALKTHLQDRGFEDVEVIQLPGALRASRTPLDNPFIQRAIEVITDSSGQAPLVTPISAFAGPLSLLKEALDDAPALCLGLDHQPSPVNFTNHAKILANLLPLVLPEPVGVEPELTFELPPEPSEELETRN